MPEKKQPSQQPEPKPPVRKTPPNRGHILPPTSAEPPMPPVKPPAAPKE